MATEQLPVNPELEHHPDQVARTAAAQQSDGQPDAGIGGVVYVTTNVPNLECEVLEGQHVRRPEGGEVGEPGDYFGGSTFACEGPTAHMLEARGYVRVVGAAA